MSCNTPTSPTVSAALSSDLREKAERGQAYMGWLQSVVRDPARYRATEADIRAKLRDFNRDHRADLKPTRAGGTRALLRTAVAVIGPTMLAHFLLSTGLGWLALPLVPLVGAALYGATSLVHDAVHFTLFPSKAANRLVGRILAPVVLLDYASFRQSHMGHHKHSQSLTKDPKYPKPPRAAKQRDPDDRPSVVSAVMRTPLELWYAAAHRIVRLPAPFRSAFYLASLFALGLPIVVFYGGEVSFRERNWKTASPWLSLAGFFALCIALALVSPFMLAFYAAALWMGMGFFFTVFVTHLTPYQVYPAVENPSIRFFSLNISDITFGPIVEYLGHTFTEHHAAHHLMPQVPSYRLAEAGAWVRDTFGHMRAPGFHFTQVDDLNLVGDALLHTVTNVKGASLVHWDTTVGELTHRKVVVGGAALA